MCEYDPKKDEFTLKIPRGGAETEANEGEASDFLKLIWRKDELILILKKWPERK